MGTSKRIAAASAALALLAQLPSTTAIAADPVSQTFNYTGSEQQYAVPAGVTSIHVVLVGGRGYDTVGGSDPARVEGDLAVTAGATLYVEVAGDGASGGMGAEDGRGGFNGGADAGRSGEFGAAGGGGGASDIRTVPRADIGSLTSRLVVAGGGGGAGHSHFGGNAGQAGLGLEGGQPGTSAAGGVGGFGGTFPGGSGSLGFGGPGGSLCVPACGSGFAGGGGGGGYFGGGGGGAGVAGGGGGGGSSHVGSATNSSVTLALNGTASVTISYIPGSGGSDAATVGADVDVRDSAACLLLATTQVSFGTLSLGDENKAAGPEIMIKNCSGNTENVFASGTAATGVGASWSLVESTETCADTLGLDRYRLLLTSIEFAAPISLSVNPKAVTTLPADFVSTETARIFMACPGSTGGGQTMSMSINYLAVEE